MIDRTVFEVRLEAHRAAATEVDWRAWQLPNEEVRRPARARIAGLLLTLASRLDPRTPPAGMHVARP